MRKGLEGFISLPEAEVEIGVNGDVGAGKAAVPEVAPKTGEPERGQDRVRKLQALIFKQAFKRYQADQQGIGSVSDQDKKVLSALLCRSNPNYDRSAPYRVELRSEVGPGPLRQARGIFCQN